MRARHTPGRTTARHRARRTARRTALCAAVLLLATACGTQQQARPDDDTRAATPTGPATARLHLAPRDGSEDVETSGELWVGVRGGTLTSVTVTDEDGRKVEGRLTRHRTRWEPLGHLDTATAYTVTATAQDPAGRTVTKRTSFTTVTPDEEFLATFTPEDGSTVGVGMPVSLTFDHRITRRQEVEQAVTVTADPPVPVEGHWFGDTRLDLRPREYWKPGTKVTLSLRLRGVKGGDGLYGTQHKDVTFTIGRSQISVVDAKTKTMRVIRDGKTIRTLPVTTGAPATPTWNGVMVISEKHRVTRMNGATVGFGDAYDIPDVPHAMRLSTSGTFIHGNYWTPRSTFGHGNVSHGCIGLFDKRGGGDRDTPAAWFYRNSLLGDVVEVRNAKDEVIAPDNGLNGWNMDWEEWTAEDH